MAKNKIITENFSDFKNPINSFKSWSDFMADEIEDSQDYLCIDREEDF